MVHHENTINGAFELVRLRSLGVERNLLSEEGGTITRNAFAKKLSVTDAHIGRLLRSGRILAVKLDSEYEYPAWQIYRGKRLPHLAQVISMLSATDALGIVIFMLLPMEALDGKRPLDVLRNGSAEELHDVLVQAEAHANVR